MLVVVVVVVMVLLRVPTATLPLQKRVIPLSEISMYITCLNKCRFCYAEPWARDVFPQLETATRERLLRLTDEELKVRVRRVFVCLCV